MWGEGIQSLFRGKTFDIDCMRPGTVSILLTVVANIFSILQEFETDKRIKQCINPVSMTI
jgi:hypothetical protein